MPGGFRSKGLGAVSNHVGKVLAWRRSDRGLSIGVWGFLGVSHILRSLSGAPVRSVQLADLGVHRRPGSQQVTCRMKWTGWDLNPRPLPCQDSDLPADLPARDALYPGPSIKVSLRVAAGSFSS